MAGSGVEFSVYDGRFCLAKLPRRSDLSQLKTEGEFLSITRDDDEVSVVADESWFHPEAEIHRGWRAIKVKGPLAFELQGVLASILDPLRDAGIGVFCLSTYSTDYIFVLDPQLEAAVGTLVKAGHHRI